MDVSNICFTSWISPPSLPNRYQKCGVNLDWMIDPPLMSVCVSLWPAVHSDGEYVGEQTVNACLYIRVFLMHMNSNVLLGFEVLQRWYFMHLGSPRPCAPPTPPPHHLTLFLCLFILPALSPAGLPATEGAQHIFRYNSTMHRWQRLLFKHAGNTNSCSGGDGKQKHWMQPDVSLSLSCFFCFF